jgi:hypothetical protein
MTNTEEIVKDICPLYKEYGSCGQCNKDLDIDDAPCYWECIANTIIREGYHKQITAHWIEKKTTMWAPSGKPYFRYEQECSHCGFTNKSKKRWSSKFCPDCGAKMGDIQ